MHLFQRKLVAFLTEHLGAKPKKIIYMYMSDGCAGQYKNCYNFTNLCHHQEDFGIPTEWHFFATSHGKSAADGIAGTVKRTASKASLQHPYKDQILTPSQLTIPMFFKGDHFAYATLHEHEDEAKFLTERFLHSRTVPGTQSLHCFIPNSISTAKVKPYSNGSMTRIERVTSVTSARIQALSPIHQRLCHSTIRTNMLAWLCYESGSRRKKLLK